MSEFVDNLNFTNVSLKEKKSNKNVLVIEFTLKDEFDFYLVLNLNNKHKDIGDFCHNFNKESVCPFCSEEEEEYSLGVCDELNNYIEEIKTILLDHPNVRLKRLFL